MISTAHGHKVECWRGYFNIPAVAAMCKMPAWLKAAIVIFIALIEIDLVEMEESIETHADTSQRYSSRSHQGEA